MSKFNSIFSRLIAISLLLFMASFIAACGGDNAGNATTAPTPAPAASPTANAVTTGGGAETIVTLSEWAINPKDVSVAAGHVKFKIVNAGNFVHNFGVVINGQNMKSKDIDPGSTGFLEIDVTAGSYKTVCDLPGHESKGMTGSLTVK